MSTRTAAHAAHERGLAIYLAAVREYVERGWPVVMLNPLHKRPTQQNWNALRHSVEDVRGWARHYAFDRPDTTPNVGVILGAASGPSGGLVDVDCDCAEACAEAPYLLPPTGRIFGRASAPASHSLYVVTDGVTKTVKFAWEDGPGTSPRTPLSLRGEGESGSPPRARGGAGGEVPHGAMLVELRSTGHQTVMPPSFHPSGEGVRWEDGKQGEPGHVTRAELERAVAKLAAAALLAKHWPGVGLRDEAALALAGMLLRAGWSEEETDTFCGAVAVAAHDEEASRRRKAAATAKRLAAGETVWGATALSERLRGDGEAVGRQARAWLGIVSESAAVGNGNQRWSPSARDSHTQGMAISEEDDHLWSVTVADVPEVALRWLWDGRIPFGGITVLDGDPGLGKSLVTIDLIARVTTGRTMPDSTPGVDGGAGAILLSAEDALATTIRPRLVAAGADLRRVVAVQTIRVVNPDTKRRTERGFILPDDVDRLEKIVERINAKLIVIDPLMAYLDSKSNSWRDQDVRAALAPLARLAEKTGAAVLILRHLTKGIGGSALYRGGGSIGIIGAARSGLVIAKDPDNPDHERVLASSKSNLGPPMPSLRYRLTVRTDTATGTTKNSMGVPTVEWLGTSELSADALLNQHMDANAEPMGAREEAIEFLRELLRDGPRPSAEVIQQRKAAGITDKTFQRARKAMGVHTKLVGYGADGRWMMALPDELPEELEVRSTPGTPDATGAAPPLTSEMVTSPRDGHPLCVTASVTDDHLCPDIPVGGMTGEHEQGHEEAAG